MALGYKRCDVCEKLIRIGFYGAAPNGQGEGLESSSALQARSLLIRVGSTLGVLTHVRGTDPA